MFGVRLRGLRKLVFVAGVVAFGCSGEGLERYDDAFCRAALKNPARAEAMEWLRISSNEAKHLGTMSVDQSLAFVHRLDSAGARRLTVVGLEPRSASSDLALVVELPSDPNSRLAVFQLYAKQVRSLGFPPMADFGQSYLYLPTQP